MKLRHQRITTIIKKRRLQTIRRLRAYNNIAFNRHCALVTQTYYVANIPSFIKLRNRRIWTKSRSGNFWEETLRKETNGEADYIECFRMGKRSFDFLCYQLQDVLKAHPNPVREPLSVEKKVAIALYKLASSCEYRVVGNVFGVHKSTVHNCVYDFVRAVNKVLRTKYIRLPGEAEAIEISNMIQEKTNVPQIFGFIDGKVLFHCVTVA